MERTGTLFEVNVGIGYVAELPATVDGFLLKEGLFFFLSFCFFSALLSER